MLCWSRVTTSSSVGQEMMLEPGWATVAERILSWLAERGL